MRRARRNYRPFKAKKTAIGTGLTGGFPDNTGEIQAIYKDGSAFSRTPHGEERASARVSNHGQLAPLSPLGPSFETALRASSDEAERGILQTSWWRPLHGRVFFDALATACVPCRQPTSLAA